jgi:hypothetical protein
VKGKPSLPYLSFPLVGVFPFFMLVFCFVARQHQHPFVHLRFVLGFTVGFTGFTVGGEAGVSTISNLVWYSH